MSDISIRVKNLSKRYRIGMKEEIHDTFASALLDFAKKPVQNLRRLRSLTRFGNGTQDPEGIIWALKDVSFEVRRGEVLGIIGRNGAGKSTLLKVLSRITYPTSGRVELHGRVSSLLEVGTGFHPELTGRENIYLNGTILGMTRLEIDGKFDEIVDFSGVEKFIDTPVKRYSSGMRVRLAFSVAAHLEPEILLVDEVLAVGDVEFQKKCLGKMGEVAGEGRTVLFVSHQMGAIQALCNKAMILNQGINTFIGEVDDALSRYMVLISEDGNDILKDRVDRLGDGQVRFHDIKLLNGEGEITELILAGDEVRILIQLFNKTILPLNVDLMITIYTYTGIAISHLNNTVTGEKIELLPGASIVHCDLEGLPLRPGTYYINIGVVNMGKLLDHIEKATKLEVIDSNFYGTGRIPKSNSPLLIRHSWGR